MQSLHKKKFIYNKYVVLCSSIITFIEIFMGGIFFCVTLYILTIMIIMIVLITIIIIMIKVIER